MISKKDLVVGTIYIDHDEDWCYIYEHTDNGFNMFYASTKDKLNAMIKDYKLMGISAVDDWINDCDWQELSYLRKKWKIQNAVVKNWRQKLE